MKVALTVTVIFVLMAAYAGAAEPGGWSWGMYFTEVAVGCSVSVTATYGIWGIRGMHSSDEIWDMFIFPAGAFGGSAAGVLLAGELAGSPSENKLKTYSMTTVGAFIYPAFVASAPIIFGGWAGAGIFVFGSLAAPFVNPFITASVYNKVKRPETEKNSAFEVKYYSKLLADNGAGPVPVYGVSVSF
jgi:hypothetical protein